MGILERAHKRDGVNGRAPMILCTECYIQQGGKTLMLYRNKKANDINQGKWIGIGGKFEPGRGIFWRLCLSL